MLPEAMLTALLRRTNHRYLGQYPDPEARIPAPVRAGSTCSTRTCRSASGCARTARSTGSSSRRTAPGSTSAPCARRCGWSRTSATTSARCTSAAARRRSCSTSCRDDRPGARAVLDQGGVRPRPAPTTFWTTAEWMRSPRASSGSPSACRASTTGCCGRWTATTSTAPAPRSSSGCRAWPARSTRSTWT